MRIVLQHALCQGGDLGENVNLKKICFSDSKPPAHVSTEFQFHPKFCYFTFLLIIKNKSIRVLLLNRFVINVQASNKTITTSVIWLPVVVLNFFSLLFSQGYHVEPCLHDHGAARMSFIKERKREASTRVQKCRTDPKCSEVLLRDNEGFVECVDGKSKLLCISYDKTIKVSHRTLFLFPLPSDFVNELPCDGVDQMSFINFETLTGGDPAAYVSTQCCSSFLDFGLFDEWKFWRVKQLSRL